MTRWLLLLTLYAAMLVPAGAFAHEVRPALVEVIERGDGRADLIWRQPVVGEVALALRPRLDALIDRPPDMVEAEAGFSTARWRGLDLGTPGLDGRTLRIEGLERTITDVLAVVRLSNGDTAEEMLTPARPSMIVDTHAGMAVSAYLRLGIAHILTGADHLLFVLGLVLLSRSLPMLLKTITAFTVAHSLTLALVALRIVAVDTATIEALVALSILFVAVELVRAARGRDGVTQRRPWLVAFSFGLLHGSAFAGALKEIGLPDGNIPAALFLFNLGVEIGQLLFITVLLVPLRWLPPSLPTRIVGRARFAVVYGIGGASAYWFVDRAATATHII